MIWIELQQRAHSPQLVGAKRKSRISWATGIEILARRRLVNLSHIRFRKRACGSFIKS